MTRGRHFSNTLRFLTCCLSFLLSLPLSAESPKRLALTQIVDHPSLNGIREGILEQLAHEGFKEGKKPNHFF